MESPARRRRALSKDCVDHCPARLGPSAEQLTAALSTVIDPEIRRPVTELGMVKSASVDADGTAASASSSPSPAAR
jgi:hypothetical protein